VTDMAGYIFTRSVCYQSGLYRMGYPVPDGAPKALLDAWIEAGSIVPALEDGEPVPPAKPAKAKPRAAEPGREGKAQPSHGPGADLVGKVPSPQARGAAPAPRKRPGKKADG